MKQSVAHLVDLFGGDHDLELVDGRFGSGSGSGDRRRVHDFDGRKLCLWLVLWLQKLASLYSPRMNRSLAWRRGSRTRRDIQLRQDDSQSHPPDIPMSDFYGTRRVNRAHPNHLGAWA